MTLLVTFLLLLIQILTFAIFARAMLSWVTMARGRPLDNPVVDILIQITEPVLAPFRQIIPRFGMMDLSPLVAILVLQFMGNIISQRF